MRILALLLLTCAVGLPGTAAATQVQPPLLAREAIDVPLTVSLGALWLVTELNLKDELVAPGFDPATYDNIGRVDRDAIGNWDPSLADASDIVLYASFAAPFVFNGIDHAIWGKDRAGLGRWIWSDALIIVESVFLAGALTNMAKWGFNRYRPYMYIKYEETAIYDEIQADEGRRDSLQEAEEERDAATSFWSGHTSLTFAALCSSATLLTYKHMSDDPGPLFGLWGGTLAVGTLVAILRVQAGKHFPTDVLVGAAVGATIGIVVPALHRNRDRLPPVAISPIAGPTGGGVAITGLW